MSWREFRVIPLLLLLLASMPLRAQQADSDRIRELEVRIEQLAQQTADLRNEIARLRSECAARPAPQSESEDLTNVDVAPALTEVRIVEGGAAPSSSKLFNPDISVIGNFLGRAARRENAREFGSGNERAPLAFDEAEVGLQAFVDPYAKASFFLGADAEGFSVEEGYAQFIALPHDLTARAGKFKAAFGKANTWHTHARPWVDQPLVIHNFFGDEQLADEGVELSKVFANRVAFVEGTAQVFAGNADGVFERRDRSDLFYDAHVKAFRDLSENSNLELGASYARGGFAPANGANAFEGIDLTVRWKPLQRGTYRSLVARFEAIRNRSPRDLHRDPRGFYASVDYQLAQRWFAGARIDRADDIGMYTAVATGTTSAAALSRDRGTSVVLTFWPSEFSQLRGQLRRTSYGSLAPVNELLFQLQFAIGAHGAHTF